MAALSFRFSMALGALSLLALAPIAAQEAGGEQKAGCPAVPAAFRPCAIQKAAAFNPPRTVDGVPNFEGMWRSGIQAFDIHAHEETFGYRGEPAIIVDPSDGQAPYQPWAAELRKRRYDVRDNPPSIELLDPNSRCFLRGVPRQMWIMQFRIHQPPGSPYILMMFEQNHAYRIIAMDGRPHLDDGIKLAMGDSRGRWEGNTLVIDTTNQSARSWLDNAGDFFTPEARVTERLTLVHPDTLLYEATIDDPKAYTRPMTLSYAISRDTAPEQQEILEFACLEGNRIIDLLRY
jgi:hypothetical protein